MPRVATTDWALNYGDELCNNRMLLSMPAGMLRDLQLLAKAQELSASEYVRRAVMRELAEYIRDHPAHALSFRGKPVPMQPGSSKSEELSPEG